MAKPNLAEIEAFIQELINKIHELKVDNIESWSQGNRKEDQASIYYVNKEINSLRLRWNEIKKGIHDKP